MCDIAATITRADLETNPHPHLHRLRETAPVAWVPVLNGWLVTRYDLAVQVMRDATTFTVDHPGFSTAQVVGPSMLSLDGADHLRHRTPFAPPFRRRPVAARFTTAVTNRNYYDNVTFHKMDRIHKMHKIFPLL